MSGVIFDKILGRIREGGDEGGGGGENYALIENTPQIITPSVDGSIANLTAEEIESLRIGDIVKATIESNGTTRDWFVVRVKTTPPQQVAMIWANENGITTRLWTKNNGVWSGENGASIGYADVARKVSIANTQPQTGMSTNTLYNLGVISQDTTFAINPAQEVGIANVWMWTFSTGSTAPMITWPQQITMWADGEAPTIEANKHYEISVMDGMATVVSADTPQS